MIGQHGVTTILNAAPGRADLGPELLDSVDILVVNETEAALLAGAGAGEVVRCGEVRAVNEPSSRMRRSCCPC